MNRPSILLCDEPFGALDALTRSNLQQELRRIWQAEKISVVLVTHDVEEAVYLGDRVVVLEPRPGRIERIVNVDVPHPRARSDARLKDLSEEVRGAIVDPGRGANRALADRPQCRHVSLRMKNVLANEAAKV